MERARIAQQRERETGANCIGWLLSNCCPSWKIVITSEGRDLLFAARGQKSKSLALLVMTIFLCALC